MRQWGQKKFWVFTWRHSRHVCAPKQRNGGHICVPTQSSGNLTLLLCKRFLLFSLKKHDCWSSEWKPTINNRNTLEWMWKIFTYHTLSFVFVLTASLSSWILKYKIIYIYMFPHSAKSLFDLWLFLLRWPHTPQAFLETSPPSRPLLLDRTGQPQHRGLYPLLFSNSNISKVTHANTNPVWPTHHACAQPFHPVN